MTTKDIKESGGYQENGKWFDSRGEEVSVNEKGVVLNENGRPRMTKDINPDGVVTKGIKGSWNGLTRTGGSLRNFLTPKQSIDESTNPSQDNKGDKNTQTINDSGTKHSDLLNSDNPIVTKNGERVKKYHLKLLLLLISKKHHIH